MAPALLNSRSCASVTKGVCVVPVCSALHRSAPLRRARPVRSTQAAQKGLLVAAAAEAAAETAIDTAADDIDVEVEDDIDDLEDGELADEEEEAPGSAPQTEQVMQAAAATTSDLEFSLNFLWMDKNIAVAVDQVFSKNTLASYLMMDVLQNQRSPVTEYFFWPRNDAWEELNAALDAKKWMSPRDRVLLLNKTTEVINYWMTEDGPKPTLEQAEQNFPECYFKGS